MSKKSEPVKLNPTIFLYAASIYMEVTWARVCQPSTSSYNKSSKRNQEPNRIANFSVRMFTKDENGEIEVGRINSLTLVSGFDREANSTCIHIDSMSDNWGGRTIYSHTFFPAGGFPTDKEGNIAYQQQRDRYREFTNRAAEAVKAFLELQVEQQKKEQEYTAMVSTSPNPALQAIKDLGESFLQRNRNRQTAQ